MKTACLIFLATCGGIVETIDPIVDEALAKYNVPGVAIGIVQNGEVVLAKGYGFRDVAQQLPVTPDTLFCLGSCTKAFTSALVGHFVQEGKMNWDDPIVKYIPEFHWPAQITLRDTLAHRTGLPRHDALWFYFNLRRSDLIGLLPKLETVCGLREKIFYNNFMYSVAAIATERVSGRSWEDEMGNFILDHFGMLDSLPSIDQIENQEDRSLGYAEINGKIKHIPYHPIPVVTPGGGIVSNVSDMTKWLQYQLSDDPLVKEMHKLQIANNPPVQLDPHTINLGYGLGWFINQYRGHSLISHGGIIDGFYAEVALLPKQKIGLVILANSSSNGHHFIHALRNTIMDQLLGVQDTDWLQGPPPIEAVAHPLFHPTHPLESYVGTYAHPAYGPVEVQLKGDRLVMTFGKTEIILTPQAADQFQIRLEPLLIFGINPYSDITFIRKNDKLIGMDVAFEKFRNLPPVRFKSE